MVRHLVTAGLLLACVSVQAEDWSRFRGPAGSGVANGSVALPTHWSPNANMAWKFEMPGPGASSPIIIGDKAFVTCYTGYGVDRNAVGELKDLMRHLICVDVKTGKKIWQKDVEAVQPEDPFSGAGVPAHGYASHTPVSDGKNVYCFFGKSGVHAFDMEGNKLWDAAVGTESDPPQWGSSSSPVVFGNVVIVVAAAESQSIIGFDKTSGKEVWRKEAKGLDNMWGTPALVKVDDKRTDLVMCVANEIWGLDPANGDFLWLAGKTGSSMAYSSVFPGTDNKRVYAMPSSRNGGGSMAVDAGGEGDVSETMVAWKGRDTASFATPVVHNGKIYNVANDVVTVIDAKTGERSGERFRLKGYMASRLEYPSPIVAGDRLFRLNSRGQVFVLALGDEPEQIAVNRLSNDDAEAFWGTPAVSNGRMLVRSSQYLYCVADKGETVSEEDMKMAKASPSAGAPAAGGNQNRRRTLNDVFAENDGNEDGKLDKSEVEKITFLPTERLMTLDKDEDGAISKEEFQNVRSLFQQRGGNRGGGNRGGRGGAGGSSKPDRPQRPKFRGDK